MTPIPYNAADRTVTAEETTLRFGCPNCPRDLAAPSDGLSCPECGHVPRQGAD